MSVPGVVGAAGQMLLSNRISAFHFHSTPIPHFLQRHNLSLSQPRSSSPCGSQSIPAQIIDRARLIPIRLIIPFIPPIRRSTKSTARNSGHQTLCLNGWICFTRCSVNAGTSDFGHHVVVSPCPLATLIRQSSARSVPKANQTPNR